MSQPILEKELRQPDEFVGFFSKILAFFSSRMHVVVWAFAGIVACLIAAFAWSYVSEKKNAKASDALGEILKSYPAVYAEKDFSTQSWEELQKKLEDFQKNYGSTSVASSAGLYQAHIKMRLGKNDEALSMYKTLQSKLSGPYAYMAKEGQAHALVELKKWDEAIALWKELSFAKDNPLRAQHMYSLALTQEDKGAASDAIQTYQTFQNEFPGSPLAEKVRSKLAATKNK